MPRYACTLLAAALLLAFTFQNVSAHEGHDDGPAPTISLPAAPRAEATSGAFELVAIAQSGELVVYLDRFASNEPVRGASIAVETPQGSADAKPVSDGTYRLAAPWSAKAGHYDLIFTVTEVGASEILPLTLDVPANAAPATSSGNRVKDASAGGITDRISANASSIVAALILAFLAGGFAGLFLGRRRTLAASLLIAAITVIIAHGAIAHEGEDHGAGASASSTDVPPQPMSASREVAQLLPDGSVFIPKSTQRILAIRTIVSESASYRRTVELPGRIIPDPNASGFVQAAVGGRLSPPAGGFPRLGTPVKKADVLAYVTTPLQAIDISDMRQRQGELDQQISIIEQRVTRYESLVPGGATPKTQLDEAKLELQGLRQRRASLDKVRQEPEPLVAPVDGIIADGSPVAGQIAQPNAIVFQIIDPKRLWVEALSYESLPDVPHATARIGDKEFGLAFRGAGFADRNQSIPIHFAIDTDLAGVRVGQFATVLAETPDEQRGLAVPRTSVVRNSAGQDLVYEHVSAERFVPRAVRIEPLDGQRVLISQGLDPGRRVVTQGAELIDHIR